MTFGRKLAAEGLGTAILLVAVVGSGIMGERLSELTRLAVAALRYILLDPRTLQRVA